jgi:type IV pilus assembly protein PilA
VSLPARHKRRLADDRGFTLIELMVVILIIGILAGLAIAVFMTQTEKSKDANAKALVRNAETAAETFAVDHNGEYKGLEPAELKKIESTLKDESYARLTLAEAKGGGYLVQAETLATKVKYSIERKESGAVSRKCEPAGTGGCPSGGSW